MNLLLSAVLLLQAQTAKDTFRKIEEMVEQAKIVTMRFKAEGKSVRGAVQTNWTEEGTILLKGDARINASATVSIAHGQQNELYESRLISDGKQMLFSYPPRKFVGQLDPQAFTVSRFQVGLMRVGASSTMGFVGSYGNLLNVGGGGLLSKGEFGISDLKDGPQTDRGSTLTFMVTYQADRFEFDAPSKLAV